MRIQLAGLTLALYFSTLQAAPIPVDFVKPIVPGPIDVSLPFVSDANADTFAEASPELRGGFFRARVQRHSGDFFALDGNVSTDAALAPEPASVFTVLMGMGALFSIVLRRKRRLQ